MLEGDSLTVVGWIASKSTIGGYTQNLLANFFHWISGLIEFLVSHQYTEENMAID